MRDILKISNRKFWYLWGGLCLLSMLVEGPLFRAFGLTVAGGYWHFVVVIPIRSLLMLQGIRLIAVIRGW